jgi:hypothetical protein
MKGRCAKCEAPARPGQRYCLGCHAAHMRRTRPKHRDLPPIARMKANARGYANSNLSRGKLKPQPCVSCGAEKAEKHHPDYSKPMEVVWLCRRCHVKLHKGQLQLQSA